MASTEPLRRLPPPLPSSLPFIGPPSAASPFSSASSSFSSSALSAPSSPPTNPNWAGDDLSLAYPVSPFDSVCLKHIRRYLQGYDRVYTRMLMDYGAERSKINQQHWERVHRLQLQQTQKLRRQHEERMRSHSVSGKRRDGDESKEQHDDNGDADTEAEPSPSSVHPDDLPSPPLDDEKAAKPAQPADNSDPEPGHLSADPPKDQPPSDPPPAYDAYDSEYAEMKAELESYHTACLSDANRRFRTMIIALTHRLDHFLSTQLSPSQLLQDLDVTLTVKSAGTHRLIQAKLTVRCVESFSDLRRRFTHYMREEQGDAVLAFTPDSQFQVLNSAVNPACRTDVSHAYIRQPLPPAKRPQDEHREEERKAATAPADTPHHHSAYSLARPLAAFRARATRVRAGYAPPPTVSSVEEEAAEPTRSGSFDLSHSTGGAGMGPWPPSPSKGRPRTAAPHTAPLEPYPMPGMSASDPSPPARSSHPPPPSGSPLPHAPLLILDEDVAIINFVADFIPHLTVHLLGAVVLVSDQAANTAAHRRPRPAPAPHHPQVKEEKRGVAGPARARGFHSLSAASRLPAKLLPHIRQHLAAAPPLPKLPPSLTAFFHRHTHPATAQADALPVVSAVAAASSDAEGDTPTAVLSPPSRHLSDVGDGLQVSEATSSPPLHSHLSVASDESGSSDESVHHVSISHSVSHSVNPIDDGADDLDDSMLTNHASRRPSYPSRRPHIRTRNHSHPLASQAGVGGVAASATLPPVGQGRYPHLSVEVDGDAGDRVDSVIPSQSFSVDIPFIDYDQESLLDTEDSRVMEASVTASERSELDRDLSAMILGAEEDDPRADDDDEDGLTSQDSARPAPGRRRRRGQFDSGGDVDVNGLLHSNGLMHSHSFSQSSFQSTPPSALPTPSISRPTSAASELMAAGILHLPPHALPSSLPSSVGSTSLPGSMPGSASSLLMLPSPSDQGQSFMAQQRLAGMGMRGSS